MTKKKVVDNIDVIDSIRYRILKNIDDKYNKGVGSFPYDLISPTSFELGYLKSEIDNASDYLSVQNLEGEMLDLRVYEITGKSRRPAVKSRGFVTITGQEGTEIPSGTLVGTETIEFQTIDDSVISNGQAIVRVECLEGGDIGNVRAGEINVFSTTVNGLETVENKEEFVNGYNEESDEELRERYYTFLQLPATSGNESHYKLWAKDVVGVGDVLVEPLWNGNGTVKVVITNVNMEEPDKELIEETAEYIETQRPVGAKVTVKGATTKDITVSADVRLAEGYEIGFVQGQFEKALNEYRRQMGFKETYVSLGRIGNLLLTEVEGVQDYDNLLLNGEAKNVGLKTEEVPKFTTVKLGVI